MGQFCSCTRVQKSIPFQNTHLMPIDKGLLLDNHVYHNIHHLSNGHISNHESNLVNSCSKNETPEFQLKNNDELQSPMEENVEQTHHDRFSYFSKFSDSSNAESIEFMGTDENLLFNEIDFSEIQIAKEVETFYRTQSEIITDLLQRVLDVLIGDLDHYYLQLYLFRTRPPSDDRLNLINSLDNSTSRDLLWDILTGQQDEDFELFCDILSNDAYNKSIVELLMALECIVALVSSYPHHSFLTCSHRLNVPHVEPSSFKVDLIEDNSINNTNLGSSTTLKGNSSTLSLSSNFFNENGDHLSLTNNKKSLPKLSVTFKKFCFCQSEQKNRFIQLVNEFSCLYGLYFLNCCLDESLLSILSDGIKRTNNFLNTLSFQSCDLDDQSYDIIKEILEKKTLRSLNFVYLTLSPSTQQNFFQSMTRNKYLNELNMSFCNLTDDACETLANVLRFCAIKTLKLKSSGITSAGCFYLSKSIIKNAYLVHLDLSCNNLGDDGAHHLSTALIHNRTVKELFLENCRINHLGMMYFSRLLKANGSLKELILSSNPFGDDGITTLSDGLCYNHSLRILQLDNCNIETPGFIQLLRALKHNRNLNIVKLCSNQIAKENQNNIDTIIFLIREVLHLNNNLKLFLRGNYMSTTLL